MLTLTHQASGINFELPENISIPFVFTNPAVAEHDSVSLSFSLKNNPVNAMLTGYPHLPGAPDNSNSIPVILNIDGAIKHCVLEIITSTETDIKANLTFNESVFFSQNGDKNLRDCDFGEDIDLVELHSEGDIDGLPAWSDDMYTKQWPQMPVAFFLFITAIFFQGRMVQYNNGGAFGGTGLVYDDSVNQFLYTFDGTDLSAFTERGSLFNIVENNYDYNDFHGFITYENYHVNNKFVFGAVGGSGGYDGIKIGFVPSDGYMSTSLNIGFFPHETSPGISNGIKIIEDQVIISSDYVNIFPNISCHLKKANIQLLPNSYNFLPTGYNLKGELRYFYNLSSNPGIYIYDGTTWKLIFATT